MMLIIIKPTAKMCPRIQTLSPNLLPQPTKSRIHPFPANLTPSQIAKPSSNPHRTLKISCSRERENLTDEMLSLELGIEIKKLNSDMVQREEALEKSRELLFAEVCDFVGLKSEDLRKKWRRMNDEERWVLVRGFIAEWSAHFHPLSARSVKEMVEEYVGGQSGDEFSDSVSGKLFPDFRKLFGFTSRNTEG